MIDPDDPFPDLVESVCVNVCGRDEGRDASFVAWLRKFLTVKLASAQSEHATWRGRAEAAERDIAETTGKSQHLQDCLYAISLAVKNEENCEDQGAQKLIRHIERILAAAPKSKEQQNADNIISLMGIDPNAALKVRAAQVIVNGTACDERKAQDLALLMGEIHKPEYFIDATNNDLRTITPAFAEVMKTLEGAETEEDASGLLDRCRRALALLRKMTGGAS